MNISLQLQYSTIWYCTVFYRIHQFISNRSENHAAFCSSMEVFMYVASNPAVGKPTSAFVENKSEPCQYKQKKPQHLVLGSLDFSCFSHIALLWWSMQDKEYIFSLFVTSWSSHKITKIDWIYILKNHFLILGKPFFIPFLIHFFSFLFLSFLCLVIVLNVFVTTRVPVTKQLGTGSEI